MTWIKFDAGAGHRSDFAKSGDCQVRALSVALGVSYREAWQMLYTMQGERSACAFELVEELHARTSSLHVVREISFPAKKGKKRMTATAFCISYKRGRYILQMPHHVAAVKDGKLLDTWDSSRKCVYRAWEIIPSVHPHEDCLRLGCVCICHTCLDGRDEAGAICPDCEGDRLRPLIGKPCGCEKSEPRT